MPGFLRLVQACLLAAMGTFMVTLALSPNYWQFLNPKYSWLTLTSGVLLTLVSFGCIIHRTRRARFDEMSALGVFLLLATLAITLPNNLFTQTPGGETEGSFTGTWPEVGPPTMSIDGTEYIRINSAELIMGETEGWVQPGNQYVVQGMVARSPELDQAGYIAVGRLFIACCFADASGVATLVEVDDPTSYDPGQWVQAAGILAPMKNPGGTLSMTGALSAITSEQYGLTDTTVTTSGQPSVPFVFEIRKEAPFAY